MNQQRYRKYLKRQTLLLALMGAALLLLVASLSIPEISHLLPPVRDAHQADFLLGSRVGMAAGCSTVILFIMIRNLLALRNDGKLEALYIKYTDERDLAIRQRACYFTLYASMVCILFLLPIVGFFSLTIYWTLYGCVVFLLACYGVCCLIFRIRKI
jgi:hypothetical protein